MRQLIREMMMELLPRYGQQDGVVKCFRPPTQIDLRLPGRQFVRRIWTAWHLRHFANAAFNVIVILVPPDRSHGSNYPAQLPAKFQRRARA